MARPRVRQVLDGTVIPLLRTEVSALRARALQDRTVVWIKRLNPVNEREFYRCLLHIIWSVRDELSGKDSGIQREFIARLVKRIEDAYKSLAVVDPEGLRLSLADTDARIWKLRMLYAGEDLAYLESLLIPLSRRVGRILKKLPHGDPTQLEFRLPG